MTDQIQAVENLLKANAATKPRTPYLDVAAGGLTTARDNMKEHVAELGRQCEARRKKLADDQAALQKLQGQVAASDFMDARRQDWQLAGRQLEATEAEARAALEGSGERRSVHFTVGAAP